MSAQHTQDGPWIDAGLTCPNPVVTGGPLRLIKSNGVVVAFLPPWLDDEEEAAEAAANARLVAAAPELFDALRRLLSAYAVSHNPESRASCWAQAHDAIAKATGEKA